MNDGSGFLDSRATKPGQTGRGLPWPISPHYGASRRRRHRPLYGPLRSDAVQVVRQFYRCGDLAAGFTRLQCPDYSHGITADLSRVQFTIAEWEHIERARERLGYAKRQDFLPGRHHRKSSQDRGRGKNLRNATDRRRFQAIPH